MKSNEEYNVKIDKKYIGDGTPGGEFEALVEIMKKLRAPDGCPWDRKQTHQSLRPYLLEETYEVIECIDNGNYDELRTELGDLLLQIVFHSQIAEEEGRFSIVDPVRALCSKMIERHPHVFGNLKLNSADEVRDEWERIKLRNNDQKKEKQGTLSGVPPALPALTRAYRVQEKMAGVGFDWETPEGALSKLREEIEELHRAIHDGNPEAVEEEIGDVLFSVVNSARLAGYGSEEALRRTIEKVIDRFTRVENMAHDDGHEVTELPLEKLDNYWDRAKVEQRKQSTKQSTSS